MSGQGRLLSHVPQAQHAQPIGGSGGPPARAVGVEHVDERAVDRPLSRRARAALPLPRVSAGMVVRWVSVRPSDVVFVKGIVEASDGLAGVFAERGGELLLAAPHGREAELGELLGDLEAELHAGGRTPGEP
jgi:hypothetical protein